MAFDRKGHYSLLTNRLTLPVQDSKPKRDQRLRLRFFICKIYIETFYFAFSKMKYSLDFIFPFDITFLTITFLENSAKLNCSKKTKKLLFIFYSCGGQESSNWSAIKDPRYRKPRGCLNLVYLSFTFLLRILLFPDKIKLWLVKQFKRYWCVNKIIRG